SVSPTTPTLQPHFITETSPKRWQALWRVIAATEADAKTMFEQFGAVQKAIAARYGGDPSVHDLPRVVRLPGFIHRKGKPFLSRAGTKNQTSRRMTGTKSAAPFRQWMMRSRHGPTRSRRALATTFRSAGNF